MGVFVFFGVGDEVLAGEGLGAAVGVEVATGGRLDFAATVGDCVTGIEL